MSTPPEQQPPAGVPTPAEVAAKQQQQSAPGSQAGKPAEEEPKVFTQEYVHQLREEAKANRIAAQEREKQLQELQTWKEEQERAALSDEERRTLEFEETRQRADAEAARAAEYQLQYEVALRAGRLGIKDPSDAVRLLDWERLEFSESGDVVNMDTVLGALLEAKPYLRGGPVQAITQHSPEGMSNPGKERAPGTELTIDAIRQMSADEINARWAEIEPIVAAHGRK